MPTFAPQILSYFNTFVLSYFYTSVLSYFYIQTFNNPKNHLVWQPLQKYSPLSMTKVE